MKRPASRLPCRPHPHLYEINTLVWLHELSQKTNRMIHLGDVPDQEWDNLEEKGFDCIWLMGIWERSPYSRSVAQDDRRLQKEYDHALPGWQPHDVMGSPYAIRSYRPNPNIATWDQLDRVLEKLHQRGMLLILDFVPNHTSVDHDWVRTHPEYYIQRTTKNAEHSEPGFFKTDLGNKALYLAHGKDPYFPPWTDTAQLNYFHEETRASMVQELKKVAQHCDGVRCDMAMLVLNDIFEKTWSDLLGTRRRPHDEFWTEALAAISDSDFIWIAEVYWDLEWTLQQLGFDFTYDKRLYDRLCRSSPQEVALHLQADMSYQRHLVRFLENHDEPRSASIFNHARLPAIAALTATLPGMRLYHQGQLEGKRRYLPVQLGRVQDEHLDLEMLNVYTRLLHITDEQVFHEGQWQLIQMRSAGDASFQNLVGYQWQSPTAQKIILINLGSIAAQGFLDLKDPTDFTRAECRPPSSFTFQDQLTGQEHRANYEDIVHRGIHVHLAPFGAQIFAFSFPQS